MVGISLSADWGEPVDVTNQRDIEAAERYVQFYLGWFATPLFNGDYPQIMKDYVGKCQVNTKANKLHLINLWSAHLAWWFTLAHCISIFCLISAARKSAQQSLSSSRLPTFSSHEKSYMRGTCDFMGISHFTTRYITQKNFPSNRGNSYFTDRDLAELVDPRWPDPGSEWLYSVPWGFRRLLNFVKVLQSTLVKGTAHPKIQFFVIIYTSLSCSKPV